MPSLQCPSCGLIGRSDNYVPARCPMCGSKKIKEVERAARAVSCFETLRPTSATSGDTGLDTPMTDVVYFHQVQITNRKI